MKKVLFILSILAITNVCFAKEFKLKSSSIGSVSKCKNTAKKAFGEFKTIENGNVHIFYQDAENYIAVYQSEKNELGSYELCARAVINNQFECRTSYFVPVLGDALEEVYMNKTDKKAHLSSRLEELLELTCNEDCMNQDDYTRSLKQFRFDTAEYIRNKYPMIFIRY